MPLFRSFRPRRIAVLRALPIADTLCAVPALRALRRECPHATITLIGLPWARSLSERLSRYVDDFLPFPGFPGFPEQPVHPPAFARFVLEARSREFDLAVQMHGDGHVSNRVARLLGARRIAGFQPDSEDEADERSRNAWLAYPDHGHEVRRLLALTRFLGCASRDESLEFPLLPADLAELHDSGLARRLAPGRYVCVHPGARSAERRWSVEHFAAVADALHETSGLPIVVTGSENERELAARMRSRMRSPAVDATGATSFGALAALVADARLLVANDTGVSQLASALRVPSVVIFSGSDPRRWAPLDAGLHRPVLARPDGDHRRAVVAQAKELLAAASDEPARLSSAPLPMRRTAVVARHRSAGSRS
ncbi:MAG: glycosyltransferase family 9 protein [Burkholderiaceae bacterium]|nr:glycosyltransferase family 9 protein [Burkholderiaceae bacterium]